HFTARGALEALGAGLEFKNGWLALRANFATVARDGKTLVDRRVGRSLTSKEAAALARELNSKVALAGAQFVFKATVAHRGALVIRAREKLSGKISNIDPAYARVKGMGAARVEFKHEVEECVPLEKTRAAQLAAKLVNEFTIKANRVLEESQVNKKRVARGLLPANAVLLRDAESNAVPPKKKMAGWIMLADMPLEIGIGRFLGMTVISLPTPAAALSKKEYALRVKKTLAALRTVKEGCGVYVHVKGPDLFGHDGDALGKTKCIKEIDASFIAPLAKKIDWARTRALITADHSTPCALRAHSADAVPVLLVGAQVKADGSREWSERECAARGSVRCASSELREMLEQ
ncbi:MAG: hypothetical protein QW343_00560, partial [Candidatus Norongarragalinales archaeon]